MEEKDFYVDFFAKEFANSKPLAKAFCVDNYYYLYDTGTNKILSCQKEVFELIDSLLKCHVPKDAIEYYISKYGEEVFCRSSVEIIDAIKQENILKLDKNTHFTLSGHFDDLEELLSTSLQSITLEITQNCNLRCQYCIYNDHVDTKRNHGNKSMDFETAMQAIDFFLKNSSKTKLIRIGFYGGEPLVQFPFIKKCVEYAKDVFKGREILFSMTTNATLINPEIANFLAHNKFSVMVSLDGPKALHDRYRIDEMGNGSFEKTLNGLKNLVENHDMDILNGQISVNVVYAPPFSAEKLNTIEKFFSSIPWMVGIPINIVYPSEGTIIKSSETFDDVREDKDIIQWAFEKYIVEFQESTSIVKQVVELSCLSWNRTHLLKSLV